MTTNQPQEDLRDKLENLISSWIKEWDGVTIYDAVGVLTVFCISRVHQQLDEDDYED